MCLFCLLCIVVYICLVIGWPNEDLFSHRHEDITPSSVGRGKKERAPLVLNWSSKNDLFCFPISIYLQSNFHINYTFLNLFLQDPSSSSDILVSVDGTINLQSQTFLYECHCKSMLDMPQPAQTELVLI